MKKTIALAVVCALALSACANPATINGVTYTKYGLVDQGERKNPNVRYRLVWGNVFWAAVLSEMFLIPTIYFVGWSLFEPVGPKVPNCIKGAVGC